MLTAYDAQVVAFVERETGDMLCADCATERTSTLTVEKAERGLTNSGGLQPVIRYTLDADWFNQAYDEAKSQIDPLDYFYDDDGEEQYWEALDTLAHRLANETLPCCDACGENLL